MKTHNVQSNDYAAPHASYAKNIAVGGLTAYAAKYLLPVTKQEVDKNYVTFVKTNVEKAREDAIDKIRNSVNKTPAHDEFIRMADNGELSNAKKVAAKASKSGAQDVRRLLNYVNNAAVEAKNLGRKVANSVVKHSRPGSVFVTTGAAIGFASALTYNIINRASKEN